MLYHTYNVIIIEYGSDFGIVIGFITKDIQSQVHL